MSIHEKLAQVQKEGKGLTQRFEMKQKLDELLHLCGGESGKPEIDSARKQVVNLGIVEILKESVDLFPEGTSLTYKEVVSGVNISFVWGYRRLRKVKDYSRGYEDLKGFDDSFEELAIISAVDRVEVLSACIEQKTRFYDTRPIGRYRSAERTYFSTTLKDAAEMTKERVEAAIVDALFKAGIRAPEPEKAKDKPKAETPTSELEIRIRRTP